MTPFAFGHHPGARRLSLLVAAGVMAAIIIAVHRSGYSSRELSAQLAANPQRKAAILMYCEDDCSQPKLLQNKQQGCAYTLWDCLQNKLFMKKGVNAAGNFTNPNEQAAFEAEAKRLKAIKPSRGALCCNISKDRGQNYVEALVKSQNVDFQQFCAGPQYLFKKGGDIEKIADFQQQCAPTCGDGVIDKEIGEECDCGNNTFTHLGGGGNPQTGKPSNGCLQFNNQPGSTCDPKTCKRTDGYCCNPGDLPNSCAAPTTKQGCFAKNKKAVWVIDPEGKADIQAACKALANPQGNRCVRTGFCCVRNPRGGVGQCLSYVATDQASCTVAGGGVFFPFQPGGEQSAATACQNSARIGCPLNAAGSPGIGCLLTGVRQQGPVGNCQNFDPNAPQNAKCGKAPCNQPLTPKTAPNCIGCPIPGTGKFQTQQQCLPACLQVAGGNGGTTGGNISGPGGGGGISGPAGGTGGPAGGGGNTGGAGTIAGGVPTGGGVAGGIPGGAGGTPSGTTGGGTTGGGTTGGGGSSSIGTEYCSTDACQKGGNELCNNKGQDCEYSPVLPCFICVAKISGHSSSYALSSYGYSSFSGSSLSSSRSSSYGYQFSSSANSSLSSSSSYGYKFSSSSNHSLSSSSLGGSYSSFSYSYSSANSSYGRCGDGIVQLGEQCDDGNLRAGDGCSPYCTFEYSSSSSSYSYSYSYSFSYSSSSSSSFSSASSYPQYCGDGILDPGEQCDDGNNVGGDGCSASCTVERGSSTPSGSSVSSAPVAQCGNGILEPGEECDDGNRTDGDGCSAFCQLEQGRCGDGIIQHALGEECEPSLPSPVPCNPLTCKLILQFCGNGQLDPGEQCDNGTANSNAPYASCRTDCTIARCGDGILTPPEQCDDGNNVGGDGCDSGCHLETTFAEATPPPSSLSGQIVTLPPFTATTLPVVPQGASYPLPGLPTLPAVNPPLQAPVAKTGPETLVVMAAGASVGFAWMRRRRRTR